MIPTALCYPGAIRIAINSVIIGKWLQTDLFIIGTVFIKRWAIAIAPSIVGVWWFWAICTDGCCVASISWCCNSVDGNIYVDERAWCLRLCW